MVSTRSACEAAFAGFAKVFPSAVGRRPAVDQRLPSFRRDHDTFGIGVQRLGDRGLALAVDVRRVDQVHAQVESPAQQRAQWSGSPTQRAPKPILLTVRDPSASSPAAPAGASAVVHVVRLQLTASCQPFHAPSSRSSSSKASTEPRKRCTHARSEMDIP